MVKPDQSQPHQGGAKAGWRPTIYKSYPTLDHTRAPLVEAMADYRRNGIIPFSTPGHKQGHAIDPAVMDLYGSKSFLADIPVSGGVDSIHFDWDTLRLAERLGADAWDSDDCFYLVNGSSTGNFAFLLAMLRPEDTVIVARDVHKSLMVALIHTGVKPVYIAPKLHHDLDIGLGIDAEDLSRALDDHPDARMVIVVSPSYCGVCSDLGAIAAMTHAHDIPLFVDEAWGPHFHFHPDLPDSAMASGADGAVTSTHKMLAAFTQSAVLNVQGEKVDYGKVAATVGMSQTTSPAAFILATIDACRRDMALNGRAMLDRAIQLAANARSRLQQLQGVSVLDGALLETASLDPTKLVIDVHGLGLTGIEVEHRLRFDHQISPEMSDATSIICLVTVGDTQETIDRLVSAMTAIRNEQGPLPAGSQSKLLRSSGAAISPGKQVMSPRDAFFAENRVIPLAEAADQVSAELVIPYPPGIPVLAPGDVISTEKLDYLKSATAIGAYISGSSDERLETIRVVCG